jgi:cytochrome P450
VDIPASFDFSSPVFRKNPYPGYRFLRQMAPVWKPPGPAPWIVSTHAGCTAVLRDNRFGHGGEQDETPEIAAEPAIANLRRMMLLRDPPAHTRLRGLVAKAFTGRRMEALRPRVTEIVDGLIDDVIETGEMDVMRDFAKKLPVTVICDMLGIPAEDRAPFFADNEVRGKLLDPVMPTRAELDEANKGVLESQAYFTKLFAYRRKNPGDDLTTALLLARENDDALTDEEALANIGLLFAAGHETTTNMIGNGVLALQRNPGQWDQLRAAPGLMANAVEEILRYDSPVQLTSRIAHEDVEVLGQKIPAGDQVIALLGAANRDAAAYSGDPETLDVARPGVKAISFGGGIHHCLGAQLARIEGEIAFARLLERLPGLRLVDTEDVTYKPTITLRGPVSLPAAWA